MGKLMVEIDTDFDIGDIVYAVPDTTDDYSIIGTVTMIEYDKYRKAIIYHIQGYDMIDRQRQTRSTAYTLSKDSINRNHMIEYKNGNIIKLDATLLEFLLEESKRMNS